VDEIDEKPKTKSKLARAPSKSKPPRTLGEVGLSLWNRITNAYAIEDEGGRELLSQACAAADRAEALRAQIDQDGEVLVIKGVMRDHPALKHEIANRSFVVRTLMRLGLSVEPVRGPGRPGSGGLGVTDTWTG
jgi:hypothetical protein